VEHTVLGETPWHSKPLKCAHRGIEAVHVVEDQRLIPVGKGLEVDAQGRGLAAQPAGAAVEGLVQAAALADAGRAEEQQQVQVARGEGTDVRIQLRVGGQAQGMRRQLGGRGHG